MKRMIIAAAVTLATMSSAFAMAGNFQNYVAGGPYVWLPPAQYDRPFKGELVIKRLPWPEIRLKCVNRDINMTPGDMRVEGCTAGAAAGRCTIYVPLRDDAHGYTPDVIARLIRHEVGHCNGWSMSHEAAR